MFAMNAEKNQFNFNVPPGITALVLAGALIAGGAVTLAILNEFSNR